MIGYRIFTYFATVSVLTVLIVAWLSIGGVIK